MNSYLRHCLDDKWHYVSLPLTCLWVISQCVVCNFQWMEVSPLLWVEAKIRRVDLNFLSSLSQQRRRRAREREREWKPATLIAQWLENKHVSKITWLYPNALSLALHSLESYQWSLTLAAQLLLLAQISSNLDRMSLQASMRESLFRSLFLNLVTASFDACSLQLIHSFSQSARLLASLTRVMTKKDRTSNH